MLIAVLIVTVLTLAAIVAAALVLPARIADLHASVVACFETIEAHIEQGRREDPRVTVLSAENAELRTMNRQSLDRVMALTHPGYLREFRRDQMAAQGVRTDLLPQREPHYGEFGEEIPDPPKDRAEFLRYLKQQGAAPSVAPPDAESRPLPSRSVAS